MARPVPKNSEVKIENHEIFFSTTDTRGVILSGNDVFVRLSGYPRKSLIGAPHNIVRHPEMPRGIFKLLWDTIGSGKPCVAYVKNLAADGSYYWVLATAMPIPEGYLSIRIKPMSAILDTVKALYPKVLEIDRAKGVDAALPFVLEQLDGLGFQDYASFMLGALTAELNARDASAKSEVERELAIIRAANMGSNDAMRRALTDSARHCTYLRSHYGGLFERLGQFLALEKGLQSKTRFIAKLAEHLKLMSINASVESTRCGSFQNVLSVVAASMQSQSDSAEKLIREIETLSVSLISGLKQAGLAIALSKLEIETLLSYLVELLKDDQGLESAEENRMDRVRADIGTLVRVLKLHSQEASAALVALMERFVKLDEGIGNLEDLILGIEVYRKTGVLEATRAGDAARGFRNLFVEMENAVLSARKELGEFRDSVRSLRTSVQAMNGDGAGRVVHELSQNIERFGTVEAEASAAN